MLKCAKIKKKEGNDMELLQLKYFCDAAESENFSATAKKFLVPPSAVSQSIKRLENEMTVSLFVRRANRIRLSESGRAFYKKAKTALNLLKDAQKQLCDDGCGGKIKLSIFINRRIVMQTVEKFSRQFPEVDIVTKYNALPEAEELDLIVTDAELDGIFERRELLCEDILLAMRVDNPLATREHIAPEDLMQAPFITTNQGSSLHHITQNVCRNMGFTPRIVICSDDPYYIRKCIELGLGVSLIPARSWQGQFSDQIVLKKIGNDRRTTYAYRNTGKYTPKCVEKFAEMLAAEFASEQRI